MKRAFASLILGTLPLPTLAAGGHADGHGHHAGTDHNTLEAGQRGELIWHFDTAGTVDFACLIPGHTEAGMVGKVRVERP